jgi:hypothetical protein
MGKSPATFDELLRRAKIQSVDRANKLRALPIVPRRVVPFGYINPVTLEPVKTVFVYEVVDKNTKRKNYYTKSTLMKLIGRNMSNYNLLTADPKKRLFRNPVTRANVKPRNIQKVRARKAESVIAHHVKRKLRR